MIYAFSPEGVACLDAVLDTGPLLAFDIDGTLAPIVEERSEARIPDETQRLLRALAERLDVAVITGRAVDDARRMLAFEPHDLVGNHGAEGIAAWKTRTDGFARTVRRWHDALRDCAALDAAGVSIEDKRFSLSLHYRQATDHDAARSAIAACIERLSPAPKVIDGKAVVNVLPPDAPDKGQALRALIAQSDAANALYVGDDDTDETVFGLHLPSVLTLRVEPSTESAAALFLRDQREVLTLIRHIARRTQTLAGPSR
ncbi:MAG TPA: trehalose-phosphatase [Casimicrobiaceae bacterium]|nr:trehalose-phosphatase [Casimicrobiaceae bacterium]